MLDVVGVCVGVAEKDTVGLGVTEGVGVWLWLMVGVGV